jgi:hypothetical protein
MNLSNYDELCQLCIDIMKWWSNNSNISYGTINVLLFVILNPLLTIIATIIAVINSISKNKKLKVVLTSSLVFMLILGVVFVTYLVLIPIMDIRTQMALEL